MNAIVSVTSDWGIGNNGRLLVRNPTDMRYFKDKTMGGTVVCGRTTFESFPGGALKGRRNVVLSGNPNYVAQGAEVVRSVADALASVRHDDPDTVWLIGGEKIYRQLLPHCSHAYVTEHEVVVPADAFFPNLESDSAWHLESKTPAGLTPAGIPFSFCVWSNSYVQHDA